MGLYSFARSFAYSFVLLCLFPSALAARSHLRSLSQPPYSLATTNLVQLFRRLKGPRYIRGYALCDTRIEAWLFKAGKQARYDATLRRRVSSSPFASPVDQEIANVTGRLPCLDFSTAIFPFPVSFRRLFYLPAFPPAASTGREEQVHLNRLEDASLDGAATPKRLDGGLLARSVSRSIDTIYGRVLKKRNSENFRARRLQLSTPEKCEKTARQLIQK